MHCSKLLCSIFCSCLFPLIVHLHCWAHLLLECCELQGGLGDKQMRDSYKYRVAQKKLPILFFIQKLCFTIFFPYFSGGVDSRPGRFFWHQYGSKWTLYYAAADKNHRGVLCRKISSSDTAAMQERFWQEQCTYWKDNSTFGGQISEDRKCGRCSQRPRLFIVRHNSWEYSEFMATPWGFPQKINRLSFKGNWHLQNISFEDPPW